MENKTGMMPANGHRIHGRSSEDFLDAREIIKELKLEGNEVFMDAGCGDGHASFEAVDILSDDGLVYALDVYDASIEDLKNAVEEKGIKNIIPICSDITDHIDLDDNTVDIILMINVFHGFKACRKIDEAIEELKRITKPGGKIAIMDYKKQEARHGPPYPVRSSPQELEDIFKSHDLKVYSLNNEIGEDIEQGKSHYLIIFEK